MPNPQRILRSQTAGQRPTGKQPGELYVNFADGVLGYIDAAGLPVDLEAGAVTVADVAPTAPKPGALWFDSVGGQLYVSYDDGSSQQWVIAVNSTPPAVDLSGYLKLTGGTLTGALFVEAGGVTVGDGVSNNAGLNLNGMSGEGRNLVGQTNGANRWMISLGDDTPEPGDGTGTNFAIINYDDAGAQIAAPFTMARSGGGASFNGNGATPYPGGWNITGGVSMLFNKAAGGETAVLVGMTGGLSRWSLYLGDITPETGGNSGSNFILQGYADDGVTQTPGAYFSINRATGDAQFAGNLTAARVFATTGLMAIYPDAAGSAALQLNNAGGTVNGGVHSTAADGIAIGNTIANSDLRFDNAANIYLSPGSPANIFQLNQGTPLWGAGGPWAAASDARIKTVQSEYALGLDEVLQLRPVNYTFKNNAKFSAHAETQADEMSHVGLVAQEVEDVFPDMVVKLDGFIDDEAVSDLRTLNTGELIFALVNCVKTLAAQNSDLSARIEALEMAR